MLEQRNLTERNNALAIEVHRMAAPGLLEAAYLAFLCLGLEADEIPFRRQVGIPVIYKGHEVPLGFRADRVRRSLLRSRPWRR